MDGIITDTEPVHAECFTRAFRETGVEATVEDYRRAVTIGELSVRDFYKSIGGKVSDFDRVKSIKDGLLIEALKNDGKLIPGVIELLRSLREAGVTTAIATSARRTSLSIILDRFDLWSYFDAFVTKDEVEAEKPDPALFVLAAKKLGVDPSECVVIEDSPKGVIGASRAGMKVIAVPNASTTDGDFSRATMVVSSLKDVTLDVIHSLV